MKRLIALTVINPLVSKLFHDLPSKYVSLKRDHGHEWVNSIRQFIPNINYAFTEKGRSNSCAVCFIKFIYHCWSTT